MWRYDKSRQCLINRDKTQGKMIENVGQVSANCYKSCKETNKKKNNKIPTFSFEAFKINIYRTCLAFFHSFKTWWRHCMVITGSNPFITLLTPTDIQCCHHDIRKSGFSVKWHTVWDDTGFRHLDVFIDEWFDNDGFTTFA